jgi:hypothetical protein
MRASTLAPDPSRGRTSPVITELNCLDLISGCGYWWDCRVVCDGFSRGFLGAGRVVVVDVLLLRVVGGLVVLLFAGRIDLQMGNAAVVVTAAAAGLHRPHLAGAS